MCVLERGAAMNELVAAYADVAGDGAVDCACEPRFDLSHRKALVMPPEEYLNEPLDTLRPVASREESGSEPRPALAIAHKMWRAATVALWRTDHDDLLGPESEAAGGREEVAAWFIHRARYIPVRLSVRERKLLRFVEGLITVTEYTTTVDSVAFAANPPKRQQRQLREIHALLQGILVAIDPDSGRQRAAERAFGPAAETFASILEAVRRYKVMNPEKMRITYGKFLYLMQGTRGAAVGRGEVLRARGAPARASRVLGAADVSSDSKGPHPFAPLRLAWRRRCRGHKAR